MFRSALYYSRPKRKEEGEKPFWISFADLMVACMTVFLVVMAVTIVSLKEQVEEIDVASKLARERQLEIKDFADELKRASKKVRPSVKVGMIKDTVRVDLGSAVKFGSGSSDISSDGKQFLRSYFKKLLKVTRGNLGRKWLKRIVVEGFTDTDGSYLFNLNLSLQRSRQVVCAMYDSPLRGEDKMKKTDLSQVRDLFLVGGYSFNSMLASKAKSRRVELKLEFWQVGEKEAAEKKPKPDLSAKAFGKC